MILVYLNFFLQRVQLLITVVDYDRVGASEPIGKVLLGCDQKGPELRHWSEMLASPRRPVAQWHTLKELECKNCHYNTSFKIRRQLILIASTGQSFFFDPWKQTAECHKVAPIMRTGDFSATQRRMPQLAFLSNFQDC